jgi:hypothetical protein
VPAKEQDPERAKHETVAKQLDGIRPIVTLIKAPPLDLLVQSAILVDDDLLCACVHSRVSIKIQIDLFPGLHVEIYHAVKGVVEGAVVVSLLVIGPSSKLAMRG